MVRRWLFYHYALKFRTVPLPRLEYESSLASLVILALVATSAKHREQLGESSWMLVFIASGGQHASASWATMQQCHRYGSREPQSQESLHCVNTNRCQHHGIASNDRMASLSQNGNSNTSQNGDLTIQNGKSWCLDTTTDLHKYHLSDK